MAKLKASYKKEPFFYPPVGRLITDDQIAMMKSEWDVKKDGSVLTIDFVVGY